MLGCRGSKGDARGEAVRPVKTSESNTRLILPEEEGKPDSERQGDLPIEKCFFEDPIDGKRLPGFESTWEPDIGERRAVANGAPILVRLWGTAHPPLKVAIGDPDGESMERLVTIRECTSAANRFFERLAARMVELEGGEVGAEEIPAMFQAALQEVIEGGKYRPGARQNGDTPPEQEG